MITDKPEELEARAAELERDIERANVAPDVLRAMREEVRLFREKAAALRKRRTDGVRFG